MTPPTSLRFVHRFRSGTLGTLVIDHVDYGDGRHGPGPLTYFWNGPRPPHGGERLKWAIEAQRIFVDPLQGLLRLRDGGRTREDGAVAVHPRETATKDPVSLRSYDQSE